MRYDVWLRGATFLPQNGTPFYRPSNLKLVMGLAKKDTDLQNDKTSVNPAANTKRKSTQVQSPNTTNVSAHGNTTDGNSASKGVHNTRSNPQGNNPMSVDKGNVGKGGDSKH